MYPYFETIRVFDGKICNLEWHQRRLSTISMLRLEDGLASVVLPQKGVYKLRVSYSHDEFGAIDISSYSARKIERLKVVECDEIEYSRKMNDRSALDRLFTQRGQADDILIVRKGQLSDTSICNILLWDGLEWFTPNEPLLRGTTIARLIYTSLVKERKIMLDDIPKFRSFMLVNAMMDFDEMRTYDTKNILR